MRADECPVCEKRGGRGVPVYRCGLNGVGEQIPFLFPHGMQRSLNEAVRLRTLGRRPRGKIAEASRPGFHPLPHLWGVRGRTSVLNERVAFLVFGAATKCAMCS